MAERLFGIVNLDILENLLPVMLEDISWDILRRTVFMHNGSPAHILSRFWGKLDRRDSPISWPACCPDLTPSELYFWRIVKDEVCTTPLITCPEFRESHPKPRRLTFDQQVLKEFRKRIDACFAVNGATFEQIF